VHSEICRAAADAGVLYRIGGEKRYLDYVRRVLVWYAENYEKFEVHGKHAGKGRIREQSLDEATQLVLTGQAYWDVREGLSAEDREKIENGYLLPDARFIHSQTRVVHNIHCWHNAAVGIVGFAVGDDELVKAAIDGPYGLKRQIRDGVKEDGFWYEGSVSYHFYTMSSLIPLYCAARGEGYGLEGTEKFRKMFVGPLDFTFDNGEFPANNDGWAGQNLYEKAGYYEVAAGLWGDKGVMRFLESIYAKGRRSEVNALLYGPARIADGDGEKRGSVLVKDSGAVILRNDRVNAYLKFGPYGGGHDHYDRLNMILYGGGGVIVPDLGTSGYGISLNGKWYRSSAAHNMPVVDGQRQERCGGYLVSYDDGVTVRAGVKDAYNGVDIQREVSLMPDGIEDSVWVKSDDVHEYDLFYHVRGTLESCSVELSSAEGFKRSNGYDMLKGLRRAECSGEADIVWSLRDAAGELRMRCASKERFELYVGTCPDNPADKEMSFVMLRKKGKDAGWANELRVEMKR